MRSEVSVGGALTGRRGLTQEGHQSLLNGAEGVKIHHVENVPLAGFTGDVLQLGVIHVGHAHHEHAVP